jgi:glycerol-3-phosphate dehydrogenase
MMSRVRSGETWDVVIIGGGATGLGTALDSASRGYRTLLLEAHDFAKGTSSRSTKLIHGGVRYLAQGRVGLVREALHERGILRRNAPHLVRNLPFVVPTYNRLGRVYYGFGLKLYDLLAGSRGFGASRMIEPREVLERLPTVRPERLRGGVVYYDGQFDDARLAITLMLSALDHGATALNYFGVTGLIKEGTRISGVRARDAETGEEFAISSRVVVNATGVFTDEIRRLDDPGVSSMLAPSQGIHLVFGGSFLPGNSALIVPRTEDGRVLFAIPWHGRTLVGTTDTPVSQPVLEPRPLAQEIEFLLEHLRRYLTPAPERSDILSQFAGLRPLVASSRGGPTSKLSREHVLAVSPSGLVTITGGKWTTYRAMAAQTVDRAAQIGGLPGRPCRTATLRLHGARETSSSTGDPFLGASSSDFDAIHSTVPGYERLLHPKLRYREYEVLGAVRVEGARTVEDVLARRTRALFLDAKASREAAPRVAAILAGELGRDAAWQAEQVRGFQELSEGYL